MKAGGCGHGAWLEGVAEALEGGEEGGGPGPGAIEAEAAAPGGGEGGGAEQPVAQRLGGGLGQVAGEADGLGLDEEVMGGEAELGPDVIVDDVVEGEVGESAGLGVADDVLGPGPLPLEQLQGGDVVIVGVGDERGVAHALDGVEQ